MDYKLLNDLAHKALNMNDCELYSFLVDQELNVTQQYIEMHFAEIVRMRPEWFSTVNNGYYGDILIMLETAKSDVAYFLAEGGFERDFMKDKKAVNTPAIMVGIKSLKGIWHIASNNPIISGLILLVIGTLITIYFHSKGLI